MRQFWALARMNSVMALYQMNLMQRRRRNGRTSHGFMVGLIVIGAILMAYMVFWAVVLSIALNPDGVEWVILPIGLIIVVFLTLGLSMLTLDSLLFDSTDTDTLFAYPVSKFTVVAGKLGGLLVQNWFIVAVLWLPFVGVYAYYAHPGPLFYLFSVLCLLIAPGVPLFIMGTVSYIVNLITSGSRFHRMYSVVLTLALVAAMGFSLTRVIPALERNAGAGGDVFVLMQRVFPPIGFMVTALVHESPLAMLAAIGWNLLPFVLISALISLSYAFIRSRVAMVRKPRRAGRVSFGDATQSQALLRKELSRLVYSPIYLINSCLGPVILVVLVLLSGRLGGNLVSVEDQLASIGVPFARVMLIFFLFMLSITNTTSPSISLEGRGLWIIKSAPVGAKPVLRAKLVLQVLVVTPLVVVASFLMMTTMHIRLVGVVTVVVPSVLFILVSACVGLVFNLHVYRLDFANDMQAVRNNASVLLTVGTMMAVVAVSTLGFVLVNHYHWMGFWAYWVVWVVIFAVATVVMYQYLMTTGVTLFEDLD